MALTVAEIEWSEPILAAAPDPAWNAEVKRRLGNVAQVHRYVAPLPWLRDFCLNVESYRTVHLSRHLTGIILMVTSQENACRYCYGANRAYMRMLGYSEAYISRIERDTKLAELDERERAVIQFSRTLARSKPRPAGPEREQLIAAGFSPAAVAEMAFVVSGGCFYNRVATLVACPPELAFERFAYGPVGRLVSLAGTVKRVLTGSRPQGTAGRASAAPLKGPYLRLGGALSDLPAAGAMGHAVESALASPVLPRRAKLLMMAVVARALDCTYCAGESRIQLVGEGFSEAETETTLAALDSPRLEPLERELLTWVRDTVHYQVGPIQQRTRELAMRIGPQAMLEAIGVASLANATARLAMLLQ